MSKFVDRRKKYNYPIVEVTWQDSASKTGWQSAPESSLLDCWTTGYLVHRDKRSIVIALNCSCQQSSSSFGDTMTIPAKVVRRVRTLK